MLKRSYLFVPGDSDRKLAKAGDSGADSLILDLEDSVAAEARPEARLRVREYLERRNEAELWVRINPLDSHDAELDLHAVLPAAPHGIVLPKPESANDVSALAMLLDALEEAIGAAVGQTRILPIVTERPGALFRLHEYAGASARLAGLTWGAEDLSAAIGASANRDADGRWLPPYELARSLCLLAAAAAEVAAIDTVYTDFRDEAGLVTYAGRARRDGFCGMMAIHPAQVAVINATFMPSGAEIERAERIIRLFEDNPGAGVLRLDGEMIDRPHYLQARRIMEVAARSGHG